jgi:hypothetical protein
MEKLFLLWAFAGWCGTLPRYWWFPPKPEPDPPPWRFASKIIGVVAGIIGGWAYTKVLGQSPTPGRPRFLLPLPRLERSCLRALSRTSPAGFAAAEGFKGRRSVNPTRSFHRGESRWRALGIHPEMEALRTASIFGDSCLAPEPRENAAKCDLVQAVGNLMVPIRVPGSARIFCDPHADKSRDRARETRRIHLSIALRIYGNET